MFQSKKINAALFKRMAWVAGSFLLSISSSPAQQIKMEATGVYFMRGVMETASVFELKPDSSFEFFFSQGALDRYGKGTWHKEADSIVFNSRPRPAKDFVWVSSKTTNDNFITVKLAEKNTMILPYTDVTIRAGDKVLRQTTDSHGEAHFPLQSVTGIALLFRLCPDRASVFNIKNSRHNFFEFRMEPWIAEIFFENFSLQLAGKELSGKHPLLQGQVFRYEKE
jgi:hypothetical protein